MTIDTAMTAQRLDVAKRHVYNVCQSGHDIIISKTISTNKDEFGAPLGETEEITLKAFPVRFTPYDRDIVNKISWAVDTDILVFISHLELNMIELTIKQIKLFDKMIHDSVTYQLRYIAPYSAFADDFLYVVIGGKK
jgi:hypothetical protein